MVSAIIRGKKTELAVLTRRRGNGLETFMGLLLFGRIEMSGLIFA